MALELIMKKSSGHPSPDLKMLRHQFEVAIPWMRNKNDYKSMQQKRTKVGNFIEDKRKRKTYLSSEMT